MHPYSEYEGGPIWVVLEGAISQLEARGDVTLTATRDQIVGFLCLQMRNLHSAQFSHTDVRVWQKLRVAKWPTEATDWERLYVATDIVRMARAGTAEHVTEYLLGPLASAVVRHQTDPIPAPLLRLICNLVDSETAEDAADAF